VGLAGTEKVILKKRIIIVDVSVSRSAGRHHETHAVQPGQQKHRWTREVLLFFKKNVSTINEQLQGKNRAGKRKEEPQVGRSVSGGIALGKRDTKPMVGPGGGRERLGEVEIRKSGERTKQFPQEGSAPPTIPRGRDSGGK